MPFISTDYDKSAKAPKGKFVGVSSNVFFSGGLSDFKSNTYYGECVTYVKAVTPGLAPTITGSWKAGDAVRGNKSIVAGTAIATFHGGSYSGQENHAAIYVKQVEEGGDDDGIYIWDQYWDHKNKPPKDAKSIGPRLLRFKAPKYVNDGNAYFVLELKS
jgi:hypothetical protein